MPDPAKALFDSLTTYARIQELIDTGETEGQYLECRAPGSPQFGPGVKAQLAEAASGFANSGGGVILWGVATDKHQGGLDVLTQIQAIGSIRRLAQQIDKELPRLAMPALALEPSRVLHQAKGDSKGMGVTYIPPTPGDPVQSTIDRKFYFRSGDEFREMPYEMLRRMFAGAAGPILRPLFDARLVKIDDKGVWRFPITLSNDSSAAARDTQICIQVENPDACAQVTTEGLRDTSEINPGDRIFMASVENPIYRGLDQLIGWLVVEMKKGSRPKRILKLTIRVYADRMRATEWRIKVQLAKAGFAIKDVIERFLY